MFSTIIIFPLFIPSLPGRIEDEPAPKKPRMDQIGGMIFPGMAPPMIMPGMAPVVPGMVPPGLVPGPSG